MLHAIILGRGKARLSPGAPHFYCPQTVGAPSLRFFLSQGWDAQLLARPYALFLAPLRGPLRLDLYCALHARRVVTEAGPWPVLRLLDQSALDRVAVHVPQLLHPLPLVMHIEIIVPPLPEPDCSARLQFSRCLLLQNLQGYRQRGAHRLANQQMNVLGHQYVACDDHPVSPPHPFKLPLEDLVSPGSAQQRFPSITTEGEKVEATRFLIA